MEIFVLICRGWKKLKLKFFNNMEHFFIAAALFMIPQLQVS
jgi:hypothetical protein